LEPDQYKALRGTTSGGNLVGCGVEVSFRSGSGSKALYVVAPAAGGPAERAGIRAGDEILEIDGQNTEEMSLYAAGNALQGAEGSTATLTVRRAERGRAKEFNVSVTREKIASKSVDYGVCEDPYNIGYLRISNFSKMTPEDVLDAFETFKQKRVDHIVLDIRNNGGGVFNAGVQVARMLIDSGDLVLIADSDGVRDVYEAEGEAVDTKTPVVVLVNKGTASASEVLAGALKDNKRAKIAGENTFGKGLIQTLVELSDGSAVTITVSKYQTPNGIDINKKGIEPDIRLGEEEMERVPVGRQKFCSWATSEETALINKILS
jgi:carboxyl-terminal processing protease